MGRPKLPIKSPKRLNNGKRRSGILRSGSQSSAGPSTSSTSGGGGGASANIRVGVRVRPLNAREAAGNFDNVINVIDERMLVFDPKEEEDAFYYQGKKRDGQRDLNKKQKKDQKFAFDAVFSPGSTNQEVFEGTTKDLVETIFNGYNCSVFAYGATGAGKTFTMLGGKDQPGITFLTMKEIYKHMETVSEEKTCEIGISYLEVYNETVMDLLNPGSQQLNVREDGKSTNIPGLTLHKPSGPEEILKLLSFGNSNRTQHATDANSESSRSHAVLQVFLKQKNKSAGLSAEVKIAKMSLIDLAGSEKGSVTAGKAARSREGSNINKSLLALGNCINNLADGSKYIPYRDSKLTRLLKDSIGGNCRTVMIANVSPSSETFEDTYNTLRYADRAKKIKINLKANVVNVNFHVAQYAKIVEDLRGEIATLKERIKQLEDENQMIKQQAPRRAQLHSDSQDMEVVSSTGSDVTVVLEPSSMNVVDSNESEIDDLTRTLNRYIERQADYDTLQIRIAEAERLSETKTQQVDALTKDVEDARRELEAEKTKTRQLEDQVKKNEVKRSREDTQDIIMCKLEEHKKLVRQYLVEQKNVTNLRLRIHFKKQLLSWNKNISVTSGDKAKNEKKLDKKVVKLLRTVERVDSKCRVSTQMLTTGHEELMKLIAAEDDEWKAKFVTAEMERVEFEAKAEISSSTIALMGTKIESLDGDLNSSLEMLRKHHLEVRGHDIATTHDRKNYEDLRERLLGQKLHWGFKEDDHDNKQVTLGTPGGSASTAPYKFYLEATKTFLPSLGPKGNLGPSPEKPSDIENYQTVATSEPSFISSDRTSVSEQSEDPADSSTEDISYELPPPTCHSEYSVTSLVSEDQSTSTPETLQSFSSPDDLVLGTPQLPRLALGRTLPVIEATPQRGKESRPPPAINITDTTVLDTPSPLSVTPKRPSSPVPGSETKRPKMESWREQEEEEENEPETHVLNETFEALTEDVGNSSKLKPIPTAGNLNDTQVLVARLDQAGLDSPVVKSRTSLELESQNINSTFSVEEAMEVDVTSRMPLMSNSSPIANVSYILGPDSDLSLDMGKKKCGSPIKAGMGVRSPTPLSHRSPSPLRQSTLIDFKTMSSSASVIPKKPSPSASGVVPRHSPRLAGGSSVRSALTTVSKRDGSKAKTPVSATPQLGRKPMRKTLKHSVSVGVLPQISSKSQSTDAKVGRSRQQSQPDGAMPTYMQATATSTTRSELSAGRKKSVSDSASSLKENPEMAKTPKSSGSVTNRLDKLRKQFSTGSVLKSNNRP